MRSFTFAVLGLAALVMAAAPGRAADGRRDAGQAPNPAAQAPGLQAAPGAAAPGVQAAPGQPGALPGLQPGGLQLQPGGLPGLPGQPFDPQKMQDQMREHMAKMMGLRIPPAQVKWDGMVLESAEAALQHQLSLKSDQGMVVTSVEAESPAATAGLKKYDVVIKVNEQNAPSDARTLVKMLGEAKADTPLDLVVMRKGKEETLKGAKLAKAALANPQGFGPGGFGPGIGAGIAPPPVLQPIPPAGIPGQPGAGLPGLPGAGFPGLPGAKGNIDLDGAKLSITRNNDKFEGEYSKDKLHITMHGKVEGNKAVPEEISVDNGQITRKYTKLQEVPASHRDVVDHMLQLVAGNGGVTLPRLAPLNPPGLNLPGGATPPTPPAPEKK